MKKSSLASGSPLVRTGIADPVADDDTDAVELVREVDHFVDWSFTPHMRNDDLRLKAGVVLPPDRHEAVRSAILRKFGPLEGGEDSLAA